MQVFFPGNGPFVLSCLGPICLNLMHFNCFWMFTIQNYRFCTLHWSDQILYQALEFATAAEKILYTALDQSTARYKKISNSLT